MTPQTIDFAHAAEALAWRRARIAGLLRNLRSGDQVVLEVLGWGFIHGRLSEVDGSSLRLASGREIAVDDVLDVQGSPPSAVGVL